MFKRKTKEIVMFVRSYDNKKETLQLYTVGGGDKMTLKMETDDSLQKYLGRQLVVKNGKVARWIKPVSTAKIFDPMPVFG